MSILLIEAPATTLDTAFSEQDAVATDGERTRGALENAELFCLAERWASKWDGRWHYEVHDGAFRHEDGRGPVLVVLGGADKALAFAKGTFGQTRHRFSVPARRS